LLIGRAAANVCQWATHVCLELSPYNKTSGPVFGQGDDHHAFSDEEDYGEFDERIIYPTHTIPSMLALSAIASLKADSTQSVESMSSSFSSSAAHDALQQLFKELPKLSESEGTLEGTGSPDEQMGLQPDHLHSNHGKGGSISCHVPKPHGLASALQINIREVLGHGNTATIYAGRFLSQGAVASQSC
jgi:hypothetical protein